MTRSITWGTAAAVLLTASSASAACSFFAAIDRDIHQPGQRALGQPVYPASGCIKLAIRGHKNRHAPGGAFNCAKIEFGKVYSYGCGHRGLLFPVFLQHLARSCQLDQLAVFPPDLFR